MNAGFSDLVVTELRRAGPDGLEKDALQKQTGLGAEELRGALAELRKAGKLGEEDGGAYVLQEAEPPLRAVEDPETPAGGEGPVETPEAASGPETAAEGELDWLPPEGVALAGVELTAFRVSFELTVEYRSRDVRAAVEDARTILADAKAGIHMKSPLLHVSESGLVVTEFRERRVWPDEKS